MVKLAVKKVYCPKCQKLVRVKSQKNGEKILFSCVICGHNIWQKGGFTWKYKKVE